MLSHTFKWLWHYRRHPEEPIIFNIHEPCFDDSDVIINIQHYVSLWYYSWGQTQCLGLFIPYVRQTPAAKILKSWDSIYNCICFCCSLSSAIGVQATVCLCPLFSNVGQGKPIITLGNYYVHILWTDLMVCIFVLWKTVLFLSDS